MDSRLFFSRIPENWEHFLPLGNGRLGAMVKTHPCCEVIQLNEEGIWSGGPIDRLNPGAKKYLYEIRELVKQGDVLNAQELAFRHFSGRCFNERVYQTAGELRIDFYSKENFGIECGFPLEHKTPQKSLETYRSCLDLETASVNVSYADDEGCEFFRKTWISAADDVLFMHVKSSQKNKINFRLYLDRGIWCDSIYTKDGFLFLQDSHGIPFTVGVGASALDGKLSAEGFTLTGSDCTEVLFFLDISTWKYKKNISKKQFDKEILKNTWEKNLHEKLICIKNQIEKKGVSESADFFFKNHIAEYSTYWNRFSFCIGKNEKTDSERTVQKLFCDYEKDDLSLVNLYADFSRYLMIAGSRKPGVLPLTLQGLWNCYMDPPWGSKYTVNINTQMNYWPSCMIRLFECEEPLFTILKRAFLNGKKASRKMYGCRGYVIHHNTDFWGDAAPQDMWLPGTYWVLGAAWLATHIWNHYEYTKDEDFLRKNYYLIHEACLFFVDFLQPSENCGIASDGKPYLVVNPSVSPENSYRTKKGQIGAFCEGCQMDNMILFHLFWSCKNAKDVLKEKTYNEKGKKYPAKDFYDFDFVLSHLKSPEKGLDGSLMEWNSEFEEVEKGHRHISHLYGLFPGISITPEKNPDFAEAALKTLEKRLSFGGGHTGWSQAWIINFYASLHKGDEAEKSVKKILQNSTLPNLLDNHPPFQIDGNFGALAGIIRMFVQSRIENNRIYVSLLPALPCKKEWQNGFIKGVGIKGGYYLDFKWNDGAISELFVYDKNGKMLSEQEISENIKFSYGNKTDF